jgi:hypothetical protein
MLNRPPVTENQKLSHDSHKMIDVNSYQSDFIANYQMKIILLTPTEFGEAIAGPGCLPKPSTHPLKARQTSSTRFHQSRISGGG